MVIVAIIIVVTLVILGKKDNTNLQEVLNGSVEIKGIVDEEKRIVVVELMDDSEEQQRWFKENINNSNDIIFKQGSSYILSIDVNQKIENIINNGPQLSSNPFDYIQVSQNEYDELLKYPKETRWIGTFSEVYCGVENGVYKIKIDDKDQDDLFWKGRFYDIEEVFDILKPIHQKAVRMQQKYDADKEN